jgi:tRNA(Ile)-lysidine synthase
MVLIAEWARSESREPPLVLTVDHGLRPGSPRHAAAVLAQAGAARLDAHVLRWRGRKPVSDVESAARTARYDLMGEWCSMHGITCLYVAHTLEDQAETFLLRLARGSGVDGLSAMSVVSEYPLPGFAGLRLARPLLGVLRARLRAVLTGRRMSWQEDAMNADPRFARARLRAAWPDLERLGLSAKRIADAARHLSRARAALEKEVEALLRLATQRKGQCVVLDGARLAAAPDEIGLRALACVLMQVSGQSFRPRMERLERLMAAIQSGVIGKGRTLHGCCIRTAAGRKGCFGPQTLRIAPEPRTRRVGWEKRGSGGDERNSDVKGNSKRELPGPGKNS